MTAESRTRSFAWMTTAQVLFSLMAIGARMVGRGIPWQEVAWSRMVVALVVTYGLAKARGQSLAIYDRKNAWMRSIFGTLAAAGSFYVYARPALPIGDAVTLINTSPIFVAILAWPLLGEKVSRGVVLAILLAFLGIVGVAQPSFQASHVVLVVGVLSSMCTAMAMTYLRKMGPGESSEAIVFHFMVVATIALTLATIPVWRTPDPASLGWLALTGLSGGLAQLAMTRAYSLDHAARVSAVGYSGVVFTRLFALPIFGEVPTLVQAAGSMLVIGAGLVLAFHKKRA